MRRRREPFTTRAPPSTGPARCSTEAASATTKARTPTALSARLKSGLANYAGSISCTRLRTPASCRLPGGLVFGSNQTSFFALDAQKGDLLWRFEAGGIINANPISFMSAGKQYVVIAA